MKSQYLTIILQSGLRALERTLEGESFVHVVEELLERIDTVVGVKSSLCLADRNSKGLVFAAAPGLSTQFQRRYRAMPLTGVAGPCHLCARIKESIVLEKISDSEFSAEFKELAREEGVFSSWTTPIRSGLGELVGVLTFYGTDEDESINVERMNHVASAIMKSLGLLIAREREERLSLLRRVNAKEEEFRLLAEMSPQMPFIADGEGNIIYYNQKFYDYIGRGDDLCGWNWKELPIHHPDDLDRTVKAWTNAVETGETYQVEYRLRRHDGEYRWHLCRALSVCDAEGRVIRWYGTNVDIHRQKCLAERLSLAINTAGLGFWEADIVDGRLTWNDKLQEMFEFGPGQFEGEIKEVIKRIHPDDYTPLKEAMANALKFEERYGIEFRIVTPKGDVRWIECHGEVHRDIDHKPIKLVGATLDITPKKMNNLALRKAKEAADQASEAKSRFLANMSHEIRTPIGVILGYTELLQMTKPAQSECEQYYRTISSSCRDLTRIIDDILDLSKVEAGRLELESRPFSLSKCLDDIHQTFKDVAKAKDLEFSINKGDVLPMQLCSDGARIKQVLINLIGNAIKFTDQGSVNVEVNVSRLESGRFQTSIDVTDTGIGLTPEQVKVLFKPFSQADTSTSRKYGGTGLGLALSKRIAQALDGDVKIIQSTPQGGSIFRFVFNAHAMDGDRLQLPELPERKASDNLEGIRVLLAEDVKQNQFLIKEILGQRGARVDVTSNGREALECAQKERYDIILMDIQMPELDGREATKLLRESGYQNPIIALTAHAMIEERKMNMQAGCDDYLTKPIDVTKLVGTIKHYYQQLNAGV